MELKVDLQRSGAVLRPAGPARRPPLLRSQTVALSAARLSTTADTHGRSMSMPAAAGGTLPPLHHLPDQTVQGMHTHYYPEGGWGCAAMEWVPADARLLRSCSLPSLAGGAADSGVDSEPPRHALAATIAQHYYLEGHWGWVVALCHALVNVLVHGLQSSFGVMAAPAAEEFRRPPLTVGWLGAMSIALSWLLSPLTIAICRRKSTRLTAVLGGLVAALGILFSSFASRFHQLFISYGTIFAVGVSMTRDASTLMVGQYFKRRRELVETVVMSGSGVGLALMSALLQGAIQAAGWRLGLQAVTGVIVLTCLLGTFYRSASLYHPQRRAILHLKHSKKKVKGKTKVEDKPPFLDFSMLRSRTVRVLLVSTSLSSLGLHTPLIYLAQQARQEGIADDSVLLLQSYLGLGWTLGCCAFGFVVVRNNQECRISRQYLYQASAFVCGVCLLALPAVQGYSGYVLFAWLYGIFYGGFQYSLKMCTYEKVRARNFAKTWGFVQGSQAIPVLIGAPVTGYINVAIGSKAGYYFSATFVVIGSISISLMDFQRRQRVLSLLKQRATAIAHSSGEQRKQELTCISEEGIADMDLPDALFEDIELELNMLQGDITSCNKVENYLMLSEYENNLIAELPERSDVESDLNSDSSIPSRLFRNFRRAKKRDAPGAGGAPL
ncbi:monocarboxylate transporter 2-like [Pollicipes pollicipes]|uniref:monocarboxylate transporter 2-like n=1 Tax=Pollicipes pollicipes TaxID=41117 RepID=UPI001884D2A2|nr:monocarboxylate transporter 2-like [Pollicipes pollicipes]